MHCASAAAVSAASLLVQMERRLDMTGPESTPAAAAADGKGDGGDVPTISAARQGGRCAGVRWVLYSVVPAC